MEREGRLFRLDGKYQRIRADITAPAADRRVSLTHVGVRDRFDRLLIPRFGVTPFEAGHTAERFVHGPEYHFVFGRPLEHAPHALYLLANMVAGPIFFDHLLSARLECQRDRI